MTGVNHGVWTGWRAGFFAALLIGVIFRLVVPPMLDGPGNDERVYAVYLTDLDRVGLGHFPELFQTYLRGAAKQEGAILPPSRIGFLAPAYWAMGFGLEPLTALRIICRGGGILGLLFAAGLCWRALPGARGVGVLTIFATLPTQGYASQYALVDGFLGMLVTGMLWVLWEHFDNEGKRRWPLVFGLLLFSAVLVKESSLFIWVALVMLVAGRAIAHKKMPSALICLALLAGPGAAMLLHFLAAGGAAVFFETLMLFMHKNQGFFYTQQFMDGPWYRYWIDVNLVNPIGGILLACGLFVAAWKERITWLMGGFFLLTYLQLASLPSGQSLRFGLMWDLPIAFFAATALLFLAARVPRHEIQIFVGMLALVAILQLAQFHFVFIKAGIYEPVTALLVRDLMMGPR